MKNFLTKSVLFMCMLICVSCSNLLNEESVDIKFNIQIPENISNTNSRNVNSEMSKMLVVLENQQMQKTETKEYLVNAGQNVTVSFDKIKVGSIIKISAEIFDSKEIKIYSGETDFIKIKSGTNDISLILKAIKNEVSEIINAKIPQITVQPVGEVKIYSETDIGNFDKSLSITATSSDSGTISYQWQVKNDEEWTNVENETNNTITISVGTGYVYTYRCVVTNTNNNVNGNKIATTISNEVTVAYVEGSLDSITAEYTGSYELLGKDFTYSNVSVTETYKRGSDNATTTITITADESRYTISPNTDSEYAIGYVPYTVTYKETTLSTIPTASLTVPVKYELDASNLVLETYFNSMHVSESDTDNAIKIPQYGTVKYVYQISDNTVTPSKLIEQNEEPIKDINNAGYYTATIVDEKNQNIPNGSICASDESYTYTVTLESANEWFVCNSNTSKDFSVKVCPWEIILTTNDGSTVNTKNISLGTYTLSISNDAYSTSQNLPSATFSCSVNDKNIITDNKLTIDEDFITGTIIASIKINEEDVEVASLEISRVNTSVTYAEGLTCAVQNDTVTLYISSAEGLATFRDIVNGTLTEDISVENESNENSNHTFRANTSYPSVNGTLRENITLSGEWTPIGVYSNETDNAIPYSGLFDGNSNTIYFEDIIYTSYNLYSSGLFQMLAGTVQNVVTDGEISRTDTGYIGSITGYLDGGTIQYCINKATISNVSTTGTGGIVGCVGTAGGKITGCINLGNISSTLNAVGGIVGTASNITDNSYANIKNCINLGEISGTSNISGIFGQSSATNVNISDCINLGKISANGTDFGYASGITTPSSNYNVSNSINVGQVSSTGETSSISGAISSIPTNGTYTNNYYDSTVNPPSVVDSSTPDITGKSTTELIGSNISLEGISADQWSFAEGRYPLPNIAESVPEQIWETVEAAATPEVSSGGEGDATQSITTFSALRSAIDEANNSSSSYTLDEPYVIYIGNSFSTEGDTASTLTISTHVKLVANNTDGCTITKTSDYAGINIFTVSSDASLTLGDETATGILTIDGAGSSSVQSTKSLINVSGTLVLNEKSVLQNSYIINSTHGGAVYSNGGTIKVHGGVVQNNTINVSTKYGGGIYLTNGTFEMTSGIFQGNSTNSSGKMYGGALYFSSCTVVITGGTFYNNSVTSTNTECCGGAIYIISSGTNDSPTQISNCTFTSNSAYQNGGAIYIGGTTCIEINNCTFNDNSVTNSTANGGAIYVANTSGGPVEILECNFEKNTANLSENTIYNDTSSSENISVTVDRTAVANKFVWNPSTSGGGLDGSIQTLSDLYSYYDSTNDCYSLTTGEYVFGNDLELDKPLYIFSGNEVTICSNTNITITSSFSDDNLIYIERQGKDNYGTLTLGNGEGILTLKHEKADFPTIASSGKLTLNNNCAITGSNYCAINVYDGNFIMNGGEIYGNKFSGSNIQSSAVTLSFTYNSSIEESCSAEFYGGKIYDNETNTSGGAIAYIGDAQPYIELSGIEIFNNKALNTGGGIYSNTATLYVNSKSRIYDNYVNATNQGASIFVTEVGGSSFFLDSDFIDVIPYTENIGS